MRHSLLFVLFLLIAGCRGEAGPAGPAGNADRTGTIRGAVILLENYSVAKEISDVSGVTIKLNPSSIMAQSDSAGNWQLAEVPPGIYSFGFSKPGFLTVHTYNFQFVGGGIYYYATILLHEVPTTPVDSLALSFDTSTYRVHFTGTVATPDSFTTSVFLLLSRTPLEGDDFQFDYFTIAYIQSNSTSFSSSYSARVFAGSTIYVKAFVNNYWTPNRNPVSGRYEFDTPNVLFSQQVSMGIP